MHGCEILFRTFQEQLAVTRNNKELAKWTLRELCLEAVLEHRQILNKVSPTSSNRIENLRKEFILIVCEFEKYIKVNYFSALVVKDDLLKMVTDDYWYWPEGDDDDDPSLVLEDFCNYVISLCITKPP